MGWADPLIYGKNQLDRIVSIEVQDNVIDVYRQLPDGSVSVEYLPNKFWMLSSYQIDPSWVRLKGNLHYKWGKQFVSQEEFYRHRGQMKNRDVYSIYNSKEAAMVKDGLTYFKGMKHNEVSILAFDIEATTLEHNKDSKVLIIANTFRNHKGEVTRKLFDFKSYGNEGTMIQEWCKWVREVNPAIICGHNIYTYDLPYIHYVAGKYGITVDLGRDGSSIQFASYESKFRKDGSQFLHYHRCNIYGRELVDTMFLAIKYDVGRKYESFGLKQIIKQEGLEVKDRQFYDAWDIKNKYHIPEEWEKIKVYAEMDGDDALALYDLMIPSFFYMTQSIPKSFQSVNESATGSQINSIMMRAYLQQGHSLPKASEETQFEGAISFGNPGIYKNVWKVDVSSLYPSCILQYEIYDQYKDPNCYFLKMVQYFTAERLKNKKLAKETGDTYYDDLQSSQKVAINSAYGFLGSTGLLFNSPKNAALVTRKGREVLEKAMKWAEIKDLQIANADTDSISVYKKDGSEFTELDRQTLLKDLNSNFPEKIRFEDDGLFKSFVVIKAKNYILWDGKKLKIKGSALKATTKEPALQMFIKDIIQTILDDKHEYLKIYDMYVKEAMDVKDIKRWATKKSITDKVLNAERTNEQKVLDAISGSEYVEGDKAYFFFRPDDTLSLVEHYDGNYNKDKMLEKLYKTAMIFDTIIPKETFLNYKLKRNKKVLEELIGTGV